MADDVTDGQLGSNTDNINQANQENNSKNKNSEKTRLSKRLKGDLKQIEVKKQSQSFVVDSDNIDSEQSKNKNIEDIGEKHFDKNKNIDTELKVEDLALPGPSGIKKQKRKASTGISFKRFGDSSEEDYKDTTSTKKGSTSNKKNKVAGEVVSYASTRKNDTLPKKSQKRKSREIPLYSPKRLRSATRLSSKNTTATSDKTAKTGGRLSRARNPPEVGDVGQTSGNLGSCASSRRQRRCRALPDPPTAMENESTEAPDNHNSTANNGALLQSSTDGPSVVAVTSLAGSGGSSTSQDGESPLGLEEGDMSRLQALLEARGLPAHLFGSLGPRMHLLLHKTFNTGAGTKAQQLMLSMQNEEEGTQLQGVMEMCQLLVMGNEETLSGFPVKQVVPVLIKLLQMEHNFDMMNHACRALTYLMEALPRSSVVVIDAVPVLLEKLQTIQCMDVAEQSLTALAMLSKRHGKNIMQCGGLGASLLFLDFFSIVAQRSALQIAANCCHSVSSEDFHFVHDSIPILSSRLNNQDKKSLESVCLAFARLVDSVQKEKSVLQELCEHDLLANLKQLLLISPPIISSGTFVMVIRMLAVMCANCPSIAVQLVKLNIVETIRYLLIGGNNIPTDDIVELVPRSPQELFELVCLISELLPNLPICGIFSIDVQLNKGLSTSYQSGTWQWRDDRNAWHTYLWVDNRIIEAAYQSGEDEISLSTLGRNYIIDFTSMQQINEDTGTIRAIQRKSVSGQTTTVATPKSNGKVEDEREFIFDKDSKLGTNVVQSLIAVIYDVYHSSVGPAVKHKCLSSLLKMLYHSPAELLKDVLSKIPISSYIAGMLLSQDLRIVTCALQKADILMSKLSEVFHSHFRREGVMHKIKGLADGDIAVLPDSPQKELLKQTDKQKQATDTSSPANINNITEPPKTFDDVDYFSSEHNPETSSSGPSTSTSRLSSLKSKKRNVKKFSRQRSSKSSSKEEMSLPPSKKLSHEMLHQKATTFTTSTSQLETTAHKGSFFSNFAPRWGRSQSYQSTSPGSSIPSEKSLKERFVREQEKNKEQIRTWIKNTAQWFYDKYFAEEAGFTHPALSTLQKLTSAAEGLFLNEESEIASLESICEVLLNEDVDGGASPFEIVHSGIVNKLLKYLTWEASKNESCCSKRIQIFLTIFVGLGKVNDINAPNPVPSANSAFLPLIQKLNLCINQLEQFPVKCQDIPGTNMAGGGSRGSSALRFFNTHQIKCNLVRHPDCANLKQWSGGAVKIDPLALVQAIERYLVVRGYGKLREGTDFETSDDDDRSDDDIEESLASQIQGSNNPRHLLEFILNDHVLPYNMTVYEAIRQYAQGNYDEGASIDEDSGPYGRASIWSGTHTLYFRPVSESNESIHTVGLRRVKTENTSKSLIKKKASNELSKPNESNAYLIDELPGNWGIGDPSLEVICLVRVLYYLNEQWEKYFDLQPATTIVPNLDFINTKLTAKATRQLQDPLVIMTGNLPSWLANLAQACPFIFPFECRQLLFYTTTFDRDRAMMKLQESMPDLTTTDSSDRVMPRLDKKKRTILRNDIFKQGEKVLNEFLNTKSLLEIQYEGEVGTGLGPTLEFYTLVSGEFQKADLCMWRGESIEILEGEGDSQKKLNYTYSRDGLFPAACPKNTKASQMAKIKSRFRYLGKFVGKACMDSRMVDLPFSHTFYKWILGQGENVDLSDMQYVDSTLYKSLTQLYDIVLQKKKIEGDISHSPESLHLSINNLMLDGVSIEDLGLDFILPGTNIELKKNGKDIPVTIDNLEEYLQLVAQFSLHDGVSRQFQAFKEGFENFFPLQSLEMFYPHEMELLLCGSKNDKWDIKDLIECCRPDHGYTSDSRAVKFLFEILSKYNSTEQRMFLQFVTGCPKLPVGGLKRLNPALTIVRKTIEGTLNPDTYLPSVMTCVNYLKLPDYSNLEIMSEQLRTAYHEGKNAFHLS